jgi:murein DD-endopeptidase MepM/ murein hydrolase activator NlpD
MAKPLKTLSVGVMGIFCLSAVAMIQPRAADFHREDAPMTDPFYAPPVERVETHVLEAGQTLTEVLNDASITGADMANLLLALREHSNPHMVGAGAEVTVRRWADDGNPRTVEVRFNADTTVRLDKSDAGWASRIAVTPTQVDTVFISGTIDEGHSLYSAMVEDDELNLPAAEKVRLVGELADIYSYKLDFAHEIQPGDSYRLVYQRETRPDGSTRKRQILASEVKNQGKLFNAFYFGGKGEASAGYFDEKGLSLRQGFSRYPVDFARITSAFSWKRYHPILGIYRAHLGTDFGAAYGSPVKATGDGVVISAGSAGGYGNLVELRHVNGYTTRYAHLSRFARGLHVGKHVSQGQVIAYVGQSGLATGPHLHYELRQNGRALDLKTAKLPPAGFINPSVKAQFAALVSDRSVLLDRARAGMQKLAHAGRDPNSKMESGR